MAISNKNLARLRRLYCRGKNPAFDKGVINSVYQALDAKWSTDKASWGQAIEDAAPGIYSNADKKELAGNYFGYRFQEDK